MLKHHDLRTIVAVGFLASIATGVVLPGCSSRLGPVQATQNGGSIDRPNLPNITVERAKECVEFDGRQLEKGRIVVESTVDVNEYGEKRGVTVGGIPATARDFDVCIRKVLQDMPIAEQSLDDAVKTLKFNRKHAGDSHDALERFIEVIPGVPIVESELVLEADGYTVVLPVTVKVRAKLEDVIDIDEATLKKLGQVAIASLGYEEIMHRAEEQGWIETVPHEQAQSIADKKFIGDVSLSPAPLPPTRLPPPPPPPTTVITETAGKRVVVTRAAPTAVARAAPGVFAPGLGEAVAVGILVVALIDAGVLEPDGIVVGVLAGAHPHGTPSVAGAGAAVGGAISAANAAPTTAAPTTAQPTPTVAKPRKYPNQTCEEDVRIRLNEEMHEICDKGYAATCSANSQKEKEMLEQIPCSTIKLSIQQRQACLAARWKVQDECFGGKPDDKHKKPIDDHQRGIDNCEALKRKNCAKGHPMANL